MHKCTSVLGHIHSSEQFNINFPKLPTILALCTALYIVQSIQFAMSQVFVFHVDSAKAL